MDDTRRRWLRMLGWVLVAGLAIAAAATAWKKGSADEPEWSYHRAAAATTFEGGLSVHNPGYLPGFAAIVRPFFLLPEPLGLALFIAIGLASSWLLFAVAWREYAAPNGMAVARPSPWHVLLFAAPFFLALRNNQVMVPMMLTVVGGDVLLRRGRSPIGAAVLALAVVIKTLPVLLCGWFVVAGRPRHALLVAVASVATTLVLGALVYGVPTSIDLHLAWPERVSGQEPAQLLRGITPRYFDDNQSVAAWIVRAAPIVGNEVALAARYGLVGAATLAAAWVWWRRRHVPGARGADGFALALTWIAFASPFGRYYYALLMLPAWLRLAAPASTDAASRSAVPRLALALPLAAWAARSDGVYALLTTATLAAQLVALWRADRSPAARDAERVDARGN